MNAFHIITFYILQVFKKGFSIMSAKKRFHISSRLGAVFYYYLDIRKEQARVNIRRAFPNFQPLQVEKILKKTYLNFCHNFIEFISLPKSYKQINIEVKGHKILQSCLKQKKGVVLISGHFGAWEVLGQWIAHNVHLFAGVAQKQKNKGAHKFFVNQRGSYYSCIIIKFPLIYFRELIIAAPLPLFFLCIIILSTFLNNFSLIKSVVPSEDPSSIRIICFLGFLIFFILLITFKIVFFSLKHGIITDK